MEYGQKLEALGGGMSQTNLTVTAGNSGNSNNGDLGDPSTTVQAKRVDVQFDFDNTAGSPTDNGTYRVFVQHSDNGTDWADAGEGHPFMSWYGSSAGDDLGASAVYSFEPKLRYYRFVIFNDNSADSVDVDIETAHQLDQDG